ncbi:MAG: murein biosynthesis integral membrane protein MurJ [Candidatus Falkowbacteria bacterium]|nr:murein biosynthesis integral membrane protein MurJ [Candidatus Falkowbacteria bacterium]
MFKDIFKRQINSITVAAALVALSSLASRLLGIIRDRILAGQFGAGTTLDIYYAAFRIPDLIYNLIVLGALSAGFIPIFTSLIKDWKCAPTEDCNPHLKNKDAWDLANNILNILLLGLVVLSLFGIIFAPALTRLIAPGFGPDEQALTATLTRIMFLSPLFLGISGIIGSILQSFKRFLIYSLAPVFYNVGIIIGAVYFVPLWGIYGLAWGVILGAFLHLVIQIPTAYHLGFRYRLKINWRDFNTWKMGKMMVPRTLGLAISQINLVVITVLASKLSAGSLAVFNFANNLQSFPIGIFGVSFAIAAFPSLAEAAFNKEKLAASFSQTMRQILFFVIPATFLIIALRAQIIRVVLGTGNFDWQDTILTMNTLGFFAISLFAQATIPLLIRVFYARHNSATPFYLGLASAGVNVVLSLFLAPKMGVAGLALAFSAASILNFLLLWIWLYLRVGVLDIGNILSAVLKFTTGSIAAGGAAQIMKVLVWPFIDMTKFSGVFTQLIAAGGFGLLVYLFFCYLLKSEELFGFIASLKNRWPFSKVKIDDQLSSNN